MGILNRFLGAQKAEKLAPFNISNNNSWQKYSPVISSNQLLKQYYGWTKRAIKIKSDAVASNLPTLYRGDDEKKQVETNSPLIKDLKHFNPKQTWRQARRLLHIHKYLTGIGAMLIMPSQTKGFINEFWVLNPLFLEYNEMDAMGFPTSYLYRTAMGKEITLPASNVIIFRAEDPETQTSGNSDVQTSNYAHNSYSVAMNLNMNYFYNMARPEAFYVLEGADPDEVAQFEQSFLSKFGGSKKAGKVAFINRRLEILELTKSLQDMQFTEGIKLMREEILGLHGVPKELAMSSGTYQNVREAQRIFQLYTLQPELTDEADVLTEQLIPAYFGKSIEELHFLAADAVDADKEQDSKIGLNMANIEARVPGTFTRNEIRAKVELPPIEGGDEIEQIQTATRAVQFSRDGYVASINRTRDKYENLFDAEIRKYFARQSKVAKAEKGFDILKESEIFVSKFTNLGVDALAAYETTYLRHRGIQNAHIIGSREWVEFYLLKTSLYFNNYTLEQIAELVLLYNDESSLLTQKFEKLYETYSKPHSGDLSRIGKISRTITGAIQGFTVHRMLLDDPTVGNSAWLSAHDSDVRNAHRDADGQTISKGEKYLVGGEYLEHPGDPNGSAENIINCRCVEVPA